MLGKKLLVIFVLLSVFACKTAQTDNDTDNNQFSSGGGSASLNWPLLFSEALHQAVEIEMGDKLEVITEQVESGDVWGEEAKGTSVLAAFVKEKEQGIRMFKVLFLPYVNFSYTIHPDQMHFPPEIITVNSHLVVFFTIAADPFYEEELIARYSDEMINVIEKFFNTAEYHNPLRDYLLSPLPLNMQVLSVREYKHFVELNIAQPGSSIPENEILSSLAPGKLVILNIITDWGPIHVRLISPEKRMIKQNLEKKLYNLYEQTLKQAESTINDQAARRQLFFEAKEKLEQILKDSSLFTDELYTELQFELLYLLYLDEWVLREEETLEVFPDYEPKLTEDTVLDYRPALSGKIDKIPEARPENLGVLVHLLEEFKDLAEQNPGTFEKGRVMLGADMDQYVPSDEECLESEVGDRIAAIAAEMSQQELRALLKQEGVTIKTLAYKKINYRHVDVMGSGRFFYADEPVEVFILK
jgi:hypothetical protein